jgi:Ca-activated chloride channel family protein
MDKYGSFLLKAEHMREQADGSTKIAAVSYGHVSNPYPREYASFEPQRDVLARAAVATGGTMDPVDVAAVFDAGGEKITYHEDLWRWFVYAAIALFILDLFVRRVRLFDRKFVAKTRRA